MPNPWLEEPKDSFRGPVRAFEDTIVTSAQFCAPPEHRHARKAALGPSRSHDTDHVRVGHGIDWLGIVALAEIVLDHCSGVEIMQRIAGFAGKDVQFRARGAFLFHPMVRYCSSSSALVKWTVGVLLIGRRRKRCRNWRRKSGVK